MILGSIFEENYKEISPKNALAIDELIDISDQEELTYTKPISSVYLHKNHNEMFLVLDCRGYLSDETLRSINTCESKVLSYVNFGSKLSEHKEYLKFNTSLIVIVNKTFDYNLKLEIEKSKRICRKIIVSVDDKDEIPANEKVMIPFCFEFNAGLDKESEVTLATELEKLYPNSEIVKKAILKREELNNEDYDTIVRWLDNE